METKQNQISKKLILRNLFWIKREIYKSSNKLDSDLIIIEKIPLPRIREKKGRKQIQYKFWNETKTKIKRDKLVQYGFSESELKTILQRKK